jgi:hypothetical protein
MALLLRRLPVAVLLLACTSVAWAEAPTTQPIEPTQFMRFRDDGRRGGALETAVVSYRNDAGQTVRLVAAIHIGERSYYEQLNRDFESDDSVLYELVKPKDAPVPTPGGEAPPSDNPISTVQHFMKDVLNLSFQLDVIDYTKPNFVHADLDRETFERLQQERGETFEMLLLRQLLESFNQPPADAADDKQEADQSLDQIVDVLTRPDMERQIKLLVARQLNDMQKSGRSFDAMAGTVMLTERNAAAMKVLATTLAEGKKQISVFYGAAHMPDLSERLRHLGFHPVSCQWLTAWDLSIRDDEPSAIEKLLREAVKQLNDSDQ